MLETTYGSQVVGHRLKGLARQATVTEPERLLKRFVERYA